MDESALSNASTDSLNKVRVGQESASPIMFCSQRTSMLVVDPVFASAIAFGSFEQGSLRPVKLSLGKGEERIS